MEYIRFFETVGINDVGLVGGKNASLGEMYQHLTHSGVNVPNGFSTTKDAYDLLLSQNGLSERIEALIGDLDVTDVAQLQSCGKAVRELILNESLPSELENAVIKRTGNSQIPTARKRSMSPYALPPQQKIFPMPALPGSRRVF